MKDDEVSSFIWLGFIAFVSICVICTIIWGFCAIGRVYSVWAQGKEGEAELARAESNRRIKILEAKAAEESSKYLSAAEVVRAKGVAEANKIIGQSLHNNEGYLRYLWIHNLENTKNQIIYVPTEAGLPILEAGKR
jgi:regulator of protease activity HflC (stomatin/prohibitin superfamily)